jgi:Cytochrome P450
MVLYPECQARAQKEIEAVVGSERLPTFDDRSLLPYVESVLQETLRCVFQFPSG